MSRNTFWYETCQIMFTKMAVKLKFSLSSLKMASSVEVLLSFIVRENRAVPKDGGRPFTFTFSQYKSYPKRLTTMTFAEVGVRFSPGYHHIMILASEAV